MEVNYYNKNAELNKTKYSVDEILEYSQPNFDLIDQYIYIYQSNQRMGLAKSKDRSEVSGGGKKPWRQKGTGRARHGSSRSPIWKGGGVTFGPTGQQNYKKTMPKKMKRGAFLSALNIHFQDNKVNVLENCTLSKTSEAVNLLNKIYNKFQNILVVQPIDGANLKIFNTIENVRIVRVSDLNTYDLVYSDNILFFDQAIDELVKIYKNL